MACCVFSRRLSVGLMSVVLALTAGCGGWPFGYIPSVVFGELAFLGRRVPIESALNDPALSQEQKDKLSFLLRARDYCRDVVGLEIGNNFRTFVNLHGEPLAWNLTGSRKDALEPYIWHLPLAGPLPYLGFFDRDKALAERARLIAAGYDTFVYEVDAFAIPILPDPVTSQLLDRGYGDLADTVAHELTHNTVMTMEDITFSESLAVFVGRTVAVEFLGIEFGEDSPLIQEAMETYEDDDTFRLFLGELIDELKALYDSDISSEEKIAMRVGVFESWRDRFAEEALPMMHFPEHYEAYGENLLNNAFLVVDRRYNSSQEIFVQAFELVGRDWSRAIDLFAAASNSGSPMQYLEDIVSSGHP